MPIDDEKLTVRALHAGGMTIHQIAAHVGKSAGWVYSRLRDKYAPKRTRDTSDVAPEPIKEGLIGESLRNELEEVRRLRSFGMTYEEIAQQLGRSIYWVHSRLKGHYQPGGVQTERLFQEQAVIPYLRDTGHLIAAECQRSTYGQFVLEADVISRYCDQTWITEVKVGAKGHEIHTAIGQLVLHRALRPDGLNVRLQIALPASARPNRLGDPILAALREAVGIQVAFVPWTGTTV